MLDHVYTCGRVSNVVNVCRYNHKDDRQKIVRCHRTYRIATDADGRRGG